MRTIVYFILPSKGYGDLILALKVCAHLQKNLEGKANVLLVSSVKDIGSLKKLYGDEEYEVPVLNIQEYIQLSKEKKFDVGCYLSGPGCYAVPEALKIPSSVPMLAITEYADHLTHKDVRWTMVYGGVLEDQSGIFCTQELVQTRDDEKAKDTYGQTIKSFSLLGENLFSSFSCSDSTAIAQYRQTYELSVEYSHGVNKRKKDGVQYSDFDRFLFVHRKMCNKTKNQDIVAIGGKVLQKFVMLTEILPALKKDGYSLITFYNSEDQDEIILESNGEQPQKKYRIFWFKSLPHRIMIALMGFSGKICGVTGDQSFVEALSAGKELIIYEALQHKRIFYVNFVEQLQKYGSKQGAELGLALSHSMYSSDFKKLRKLLQDKEAVEDYHRACQQILKKHDLGASLLKIVRQLVNKPSSPLQVESFFSSVPKENEEGPVDKKKVLKVG